MTPEELRKAMMNAAPQPSPEKRLDWLEADSAAQRTAILKLERQIARLQVRADRNAAGFARVAAEAERAKFLHKQEIAALQKRCEEAERTALQAAECHARETRRADALQKRVAELEDFCEDYLVRFELFHITNTLEAPEDATGFLAEKARAILGAALTGGKDG